MGLISGILWAVLAVGATFMGWQTAQTPEQLSVHTGVIPALAFVWTITILALLPTPLREIIAMPVRWLRRHPILYWFIVLVYIAGALTIWTVKFQPTNGRWTTPVEYCLLLVAAWGLLFLLAYRFDRETLRAVGVRLGKSKLTGVMITLTTFVILFGAAEAWMRINYITTDAYGFTSMNYYWYTNFYWNSKNSLGYRDYEPTPDDPANPLRRVAIVGDSFAVGHGMNNIDLTFPQLLEQQLGGGWDVNLIAESGWDSDVEQYWLDQYPYQPEIVVLSYYLNDIDYLLTTPENNPDANFTFIENPILASFIRDWFFVPNYIYYNLLQFTSGQRNSNFVNDLVDAHMDDTIWSQQAAQLESLINYTNTNNQRLIVLVWPNLAGIDVSAPAVNRVSEFFTERGVQVVNMSEPLRPYTVTETIVNRFDTHPGPLAQQLAADALYAAIQNGE